MTCRHHCTSLERQGSLENDELRNYSAEALLSTMYSGGENLCNVTLNSWLYTSFPPLKNKGGACVNSNTFLAATCPDLFASSVSFAKYLKERVFDKETLLFKVSG